MADFAPRRDVQAISHVNVVVDEIEVATEFYPWGVRWEMEQGRPVDRAVKGIMG